MKPITFLLLIVSFGCFAQADYDALMSAQYKSDGPGGVALVAKGGKVLYRKAFGMADLENNVVMTPDHVFEIGSITKQFTAVSILMLMEQGKLKLDDPVTKFIDNYPMHGHTITIHHLLTHTSGIKSYTSMERWRKLWRNDMTPLEMIDLFKGEPMDFAPGEKWSYNNSAYFMLGYIIEKASGTPYPEFLEKNIFTPLGMKNTYFGSQSKIIKNRARGYQKSDGYMNAEYLSLTQPYAAGSIMANVDDLLIWQQAITANKLVKKETIQKAFTNYKLNNGKPTNYGYGWGVDEINGSPTVEHSGGIFGYTTNGIYLPKEDVYVALFDNCDCFSPEEISIEMAAIAIGKPYPAKAAKIKLDDAYGKSLSGVYDFEDGATRIITWENGQLSSQRTGGKKFKLLAQDKLNFIFDEGLTSYQFVPDKTGAIKELLFKARASVWKGIKSDKPVPSHIEIGMSPDDKKAFVGIYKIQPNFALTITVEEGRLMSQATGQEKVELFPEGPEKFFLKVVDAQVEFVKNAEGKYAKLILHQGGQNIEGTRE